MNFVCHHCLYKTNIKFNIERHIKNIHLKNNSFDNKSKIICPICNSKWHLRKLLRTHLTDEHNISINEESLTFSSNAEFMAWKKAIEIKNRCRYVVKEGERKKNEVQARYFYCHRDGIFQPKVAKRKKLLKSQGSNKIGSSCPSQIICRKTKEVIDVKYISTHCGHDSNTGRLFMSKDERVAIAGKIKTGVPFDTILDEIRDNVSSVANPITLTSKQDLRNIARDFQLEPSKSHINDAISVDEWYKKVSIIDEDFNPVLYYKAQGEISTDERHDKNDVVLIIATAFQKELLKKFGNNIVRTDSIHGLNQYDFHLTTLEIVDEYGSGVPAVFCISNKKDANIFSVLYEKLKSEVGLLKPKVFMSDDDDACYNAWKGIMGEVPHRLLCTWHVTRAWRKNFIEKIGDDNKRLDKCIDALMKYARDIMFQRLRKISKKQRPSKIQSILKSHQLSASIQSITRDIDLNSWHVQSSKNKDINYEIKQMQDKIQICSNECLLICEQCTPQICIHSFSCECVDYLIKNNICKHIHACVTFISLENMGDEKFFKCESNGKQVSDIEALTPFIEASNRDKENKKLSIIKSKYEAILGFLTSISTITDEEASILEQKADQILTIVAKPHVKFVEQSKLAISNNESTNKTAEKRRRLFTTKAKRKSVKENLSIPTSVETANLIKSMPKSEWLAENIHVEFDHTYA